MKLAFATIMLMVFCANMKAAPAYAEYYTGASKSKEYQIKAAFIYNFLSFIDWPKEFRKTANNLSICIIGDDPFLKHIDVLEGKISTKKQITIIRLKNKEDLSSNLCNILFISQSRESDFKDIINKVRNKPVLTISDIDYFAHEGGIIGFVNEGEKIKFEINNNIAKKYNLKIGSMILELADIIK